MKHLFATAIAAGFLAGAHGEVKFPEPAAGIDFQAYPEAEDEWVPNDQLRPIETHRLIARFATCLPVSHNWLLAANAMVGNPAQPDIKDGEDHQSPSDEVVTAEPLDTRSQGLATIRKFSNKNRVPPELRDELSALDPRKGGWVSEVISEAVGKQLEKLGAALGQVDRLEPGQLKGFLAEGFQCGELRPKALKTDYHENGLVVRRGKSRVQSFQGTQGFIQALKILVSPFGESQALHSKFGVTHVEADRNLSTTRIIVEISGYGPERRIQQNALWLCSWSPPPQRGEYPRLKEIIVEDYEEVETEQTEPLFTDCTTTVLGNNPSFHSQISRGIDYWRERLDWRFTQELIGQHGLAVGDANGDGMDDLFVCETGGVPNKLFLQRDDGTAEDVTVDAGVGFFEPTYSALLIDLDNDADQDLVFASGRYLVFMENDGQARFSRRGVHQSDSVARSMTAIDYDSDSRLDIYVCGYFSRSGDSIGLGRPTPYHDANNGVRNYLLRNGGAWSFEDVTKQVGLHQNNQRFSYAASWEDYDNDGDPDLYVANDFGRNNLYRNHEGLFRDIAAEAGVEDIAAGMSVSWGDYNRDGRPDLYVSNMFSKAGNRVAYQQRYRAGQSGSTRELYQRHARGNSLFENLGNGSFQDVSIEANVTMGRWAWGSNFVDLNNDGWEDIVVANGLVTSQEDTGDL